MLYNMSYLIEWICFEVVILNKLCNFISLYRSPSQFLGEWENLSNLDLTLEALAQKMSFLKIITRDVFNARHDERWSYDSTTAEGIQLITRHLSTG